MSSCAKRFGLVFHHAPAWVSNPDPERICQSSSKLAGLAFVSCIKAGILERPNAGGLAVTQAISVGWLKLGARVAETVMMLVFALSMVRVESLDALAGMFGLSGNRDLAEPLA